PLVEGAGLVDALVALEADELAVRRGRDGSRESGLADARGPLDEQRLAELVGEVDRRRDRVGGEVAVGREPLADVVDGGEAGGVRHARQSAGPLHDVTRGYDDTLAQVHHAHPGTPA